MSELVAVTVFTQGPLPTRHTHVDMRLLLRCRVFRLIGEVCSKSEEANIWER